MYQLSTVREFLNRYNTLDYFLRELVNGEEGKGYISIYKDTLDDLMEQMQFKSLNMLRNQLAHGVYLSDNPIMVAEDILIFLDKHIDYVMKSKEHVKSKMLVAIEKRKIKDAEKKALEENKDKETNSKDEVDETKDLKISKLKENYSNSDADKRKHIINEIFKKYCIQARCFGYKIVHPVTKFFIEYSSNTSVTRVAKIIPEIKESLDNISLRFVEDVPNVKYSIIEIVNSDLEKFTFKEFVKCFEKSSNENILIPFGFSATNKLVCENPLGNICLKYENDVADIYLKMIIGTLASKYNPSALKISYFGKTQDDVTLKFVNSLKHKEVVEFKEDKIIEALNNIYELVNERYKLFVKEECNSIQEYNSKNASNPIHYSLVFVKIDSLSNNFNLFSLLLRIASKSRGTGVSVFWMAHKNVDFKKTPLSILASNTLVKVELSNDQIAVLYSPNYIDGEVLQIPKFSEKTFNSFVKPLKFNELMNVGKYEEDHLYEKIKAWSLTQEYVSVSKIQREFQIGFIKSGKMFALLQEEGIVSWDYHSYKGCKVLK